MKELQEIVRIYRENRDEKLCLATVVKTCGSSYRKAGARMLIMNRRQVFGSISGGCLEADVIAQSEQIMRGAESRLLTYDTTQEEDLIFGVGLGCNGVMEILLEPINYGDSCARQLRFVKKLFNERSTGVIATVIRCGATSNVKVGSRLMLDNSGELLGDLANHETRERIVPAMLRALDEKQSENCAFNTSAGTLEVFIELIAPPTRLVIFGGGYDAVSLARMAGEVGLAVTVVDHRAAFATRERFPEADAVILGRAETVDLAAVIDPGDTAVIMSHNYMADQEWLRRLLPMGLRYVGLMGPRKRAEKMLQELRAQGLEFTESSLGALHNPVGLDIGADTPEQIALSIVAEIQAVLNGHSGAQLREKKSPIHLPDRLFPRATSAEEKLACLVSA